MKVAQKMKISSRKCPLHFQTKQKSKSPFIRSSTWDLPSFFYFFSFFLSPSVYSFICLRSQKYIPVFQLYYIIIKLQYKASTPYFLHPRNTKRRDDYLLPSSPSSPCAHSLPSSSSSSSSSSETSTSLFSNEIPPLIYRNALHLAVTYDAADVVRLLLRHNVDPQSIGVLNQIGTPENDNNNFNIQSTPPAVTCAEIISNDHSSSEIVSQESTALSRSGSNTSSMNRVYFPLHVMSKTLISRNSSRTSSPKSVQLSSERCSIEASPLKSATIQSSAARFCIQQSSFQKLREKELGE